MNHSFFCSIFEQIFAKRDYSLPPPFHVQTLKRRWCVCFVVIVETKIKNSSKTPKKKLSERDGERQRERQKREKGILYLAVLLSSERPDEIRQ